MGRLTTPVLRAKPACSGLVRTGLRETYRLEARLIRGGILRHRIMATITQHHIATRHRLDFMVRHITIRHIDISISRRLGGDGKHVDR